jgi:hypothetical protein
MSEQPQLAGCESVGLALVHYSARGIYRRRVLECCTCERRTPFVIRWDGAWYGTTQYCTVCLDGWMDGERLTRPFRRGWKKERAAKIREMWDAAMLPDRWRAWTRWDMHRATCDVWESGTCAECETRPS